MLRNQYLDFPLSQRFEELKVSFERLGDVINQETESNFSDKNNISMPEIKGQIKYHNVDYKYQENGNKILDNINIELKINLNWYCWEKRKW